MRGERSELLERRIDKLALLRERGIRAFAYRYDRTHRAREALECFEKAEEAGTLSGDGDGDEVGIPGRLVSYRSHGRSAFAHIEDESGRIQLYFRETLGDASATSVFSTRRSGSGRGALSFARARAR